MNHAALQALRAKLAKDDAVYGLWITLESPSITEMAVSLGLDWVVLDAEHGHLDWSELVAHVRCVARSTTVCLIRLASLDAGLIKRALDIGADGVVIPWMESAEQVQSALFAATYPLRGRRGIGAERATAWGRGIASHVAQAGDILVVPLIESVEGGRQAAAMAAVAGVELFLIGPADWSATAGYAGQWAGPEVAQQIQAACTAIRAAGKHVGIVTTSDDDLRQRRRDGFRMLALGIDGALILRALDGMLPATGSLRTVTPALVPSMLGTSSSPLREVPIGLRAERQVRHITPAEAPRIELDDRAVVTSLIGRHCAARGMTAALVRFAPGGGLVRHVHPQPETVVVLQGAIVTEMDGRRHRVETGGCITIPAGTAHRTGNADSQSDALIHVAMPCDAIARTVSPAAADTPAAVDAPAAVPRDERSESGERELALESLVEYAGPRDPRSGIRLRSLRLRTGALLVPRLQSVDSALVVVSGQVRVRSDKGTWTVAAGEGLHLPRGTPYQIQGQGTHPIHVIETCADSHPLDAVIDVSVLCAWPADVAAARAS